MLGLARVVPTRPEVEEASCWLVCFHRRAATAWINRIPGRYKHVSVIGYFPAARSWVLYDPALVGTTIAVFADTETGMRGMGEWIDDCLVVKVPRVQARVARVGRLGFWCVPATRHLVGVAGRALFPDGFLSDCLRHGGEIAATEMAEHGDQSTETEGGSGTGCTTGHFEAAARG